MRSYTSHLGLERLPLPLRVVTYYGNVRPTARSWRKAVLGPFRRIILGDAPVPDTVPVFGVESVEQLKRTLDDFRGMLQHLNTASSRRGPLEMQDLADSIHRHARLRVVRQSYDRRSGRFKPIWDTESRSFSELLYSHLELSFTLVPVHYLHRCLACEHFFFTPSGQRAKYCTGRCQIRTAMKKYRARKKLRQGVTSKA